MQRSFPNIKHMLVVGIAGGMPRYGVDMQEQIVLGDVVIGVPQNRDGGVAHYEFGAWEGKTQLRVSGHTLHPSPSLLTAANILRSLHMQKPGTQIPHFLHQLRENLDCHDLEDFKDPGPENDLLFDEDYPHSDRNRLCEGLCDTTRSKSRCKRGSGAMRKEDTPRIHYGTIGSASTLVISSEKRNELYQKHNVICFEMESAGVLGNFPGLVIRGVCDYADSHKNKRWQKYAAATAAACAKELLLLVPSAKSIPEDLKSGSASSTPELNVIGNSPSGGMTDVYTIELINNSGAGGKVYNIYSAKAAVEGGGNTADTVHSVVWFRSRTLGIGQRTSLRFDNKFYGFLGSRLGEIIDVQENKPVVVGSNRAKGTILLLDQSSVFRPIPPDNEVPAPGNQQFTIVTDERLDPDGDVIGISRGKLTSTGIMPAPTVVVDLKPNVVYNFTIDNAVYVKATNFPERTVQKAPDYNDKNAARIEFRGNKRKATVIEDDKGYFTVVYSRGD
ncbi:purine and uridine phosphorylase [Aspergillus terreus]|uniref:Purine and uridine phosphorylase n=1 Tax=Aspergillus terreus TaxID=33178 RepID=A0A5M3ZE35_ASPTE|nr:hypothetical protein ATETN484_0017013600 [Aspergillus terreus]GFF21807.1 purine and uridine phosphorylase [Aspergillus terreus]